LCLNPIFPEISRSKMAVATMSLSEPVTETVILHLKNGVNLENVSSGADASGSTAEEVFVELTNIIKAQQGFLTQFWGHQVEHPDVFVWSIDWRSYGDGVTFRNSEEHKPFAAAFSRVFDLEVAAPLIMYTRFSSNEALAAFRAPVTEIAFMTLPNRPDEEMKASIEEQMKPIGRDVETVGKSWGSAIGWVSEVIQRDAAPDIKLICLHGVFGYASIEDHWRWRETPEHAQALEIMEAIVERTQLASAIVGGEEMFHVEFREGS